MCHVELGMSVTLRELHQAAAGKQFIDLWELKRCYSGSSLLPTF
jgi:hypothetical protein